MGWTQLGTSNGPPPLHHSGFAYDAESQRAIIFGGANETWSDETWLWDGSRWQLANSPTNPPAREKAALAYDEARDRVVLFGGTTAEMLFADTWIWNGSVWQSMRPEHSPPARCCHMLVYDSQRQQVLLFGGYDPNTGTFFSDTWAWNGNDWTELICCDAPYASGHTLTHFTDDGEVVAVLNGATTGTWVWDGQRWAMLTTAPEPARTDARMVTESQYQRLVYFGGYHDGLLLDDTWIFDGEAWRQLTLPHPPPARYAHSLFYDARRHSVILFGGIGQDGAVLNDMWELVLPEDLTPLAVATSLAP